MTDTQIRKIFFWILTLVFFATAPIVVFHAMGYRFSFDRGIFIYTGSITLKPTPKEINVFIDNRPISKGVINFLNYSYHIDGIKPGKHSLRIEMPGFQTWFKDVYVHSGLSTEFWNIFLVKTKYKKTTYDIGSVDNFFISPDNKKFALIENDSNGATVKILDIKKKKTEYKFSFNGFSFLKKERENIEWSPKEGRLSIPLSKGNKKEYFVVNIGNKEIINLNELLNKDNLSMVRWSSKEKNMILYMYNGNLFKLNLTTNTEKRMADNIFGYDLSGGYFYYLSKQNGIIYRGKVKGNSSIEQISTEPIDVSEGDNFRIIVYDENRIAIISQNGDLYLYNNSDDKTIKKIGENVLGLHFSDDGKKMLYWTNKEISVYFLRKWDTQPERKEGEIINVVRFFENIGNVEWFRDYEHIIFTVGKQIKIAEIDRRSHRNTYDILDTKYAFPKVVYSGREDDLFFIDYDKEGDRKFYSISLKNE